MKFFRSTAIAGLLLGALGMGCADEVPELSLPSRDIATFNEQIYPILLRDCGFHACHGSQERFYQVFGPAHGRLRPQPPSMDEALDPLAAAPVMPTVAPMPTVGVPPAVTAIGVAPFDPATEEEMLHSYQRAISMIDSENPEASLLLRKPLSAGAGGVGHQGVDLLGRDVYQNEDDLSYSILKQWVVAPSIVVPPPGTVAP